MGVLIFRFLVVAAVTAAGWFFPAFGLDKPVSAAAACAAAALIVFLETRIRRTPFKIIWGSTVGTFLGVALGWGLGAVYRAVAGDAPTAAFLRIFFLVVMPYVGFLVGTRKSEWLDPAYLFHFFRETSVGRSYKILDTSVIIDGRIADLCEAGFIEGTLVVPQFVLRELQLIGDSADALKRQRGRRGLDILDHLQKSKAAAVMITEMDFPDVRDVDTKIIELARRLDARIVTNDLNLNKIARLRGLTVMSINELAAALKPVVLPGESMRVFLIKEGKEKDQGVAYLDDGTMVVVDNARRLIGRNIDVTVTSVLQTTVGKMIFGRANEEAK